MAQVSVQVIGGSVQVIEANTVAEVKQKLGLANYTAKVNKVPAADDQSLQDFQLVTLAENVKGA